MCIVIYRPIVLQIKKSASLLLIKYGNWWSSRSSRNEGKGEELNKCAALFIHCLCCSQLHSSSVGYCAYITSCYCQPIVSDVRGTVHFP